MTDAPIITEARPCPDGCGHRMTVRGTDASHMGFALVLMKARWTGDTATTDAVTDAIAASELLRSGIELALSLIMSSCSGLSGVDDFEQARLIDRETGALWLESMAATYRLQGRESAARLSLDLSAILCADGPADELDLHTVDLATVLDVCAGLIQMTEERRGIRAGRQFATYDRMVPLIVPTA